MKRKVDRSRDRASAPAPRAASDAVARYLPKHEAIGHGATERPKRVAEHGSFKIEPRGQIRARRALRPVLPRMEGPTDLEGRNGYGMPAHWASRLVAPEHRLRPAVYVRHSHDRRRSVDRSIDAAREAACLVRGVDDEPYVFVDEAHAVDPRPWLRGLLRLVETGTVDVVAIARIDDLGRDPIAISRILQKIEEAGAILVAPEVGRLTLSMTMMSGYMTELRRSARRTLSKRRD